MKIEEFEDIISHYRWLLGIKTAYQAHLNYMSKMKDCYTICGIVYQAGGDARTMDINPHKPIDPSYLAVALENAISRIDDELKESAEKLRQAGFDV